jgi:disulfide bond formation protein DsbB
VVLGLAALGTLAGAAVAGLHCGVEFGWWPSPLPECNGAITPGAPLPMFPATPCDRPVYLVHALPVSMAQIDFAAELAFTILLVAYVLRARRV